MELTESGSSLNLAGAFQSGYVLPWFRTINSPHLTYIDANEDCKLTNYDSNTNIPTFSCFLSNWSDNNSTGYMEGIGQSVYFKANDYYSYCIAIEGDIIDCSVTSNGSGRLVLRAGNNLELQDMNQPANYYHSLPPPFTNNDAEIITEINFLPNQSINFETEYFPNENYQDFEIVNTSIVDGITYFSLNNASIKCKTSSLINIISQVSDLVVNFTSTNASSMPFSDYKWDFGDGAISTEAEPIHEYANPGFYNVCLKIVDINGCCAELCEEIEITPPPPTCPMDANTIFLDGTNPDMDQLSEMAMFTSSTVNGVDFVVKGDFIFDVNIDFNGCRFYFEPGAGLTIKSPGTVRVRSSTLQGCNKMWRGINVVGTEPENRFIFTDNMISDAYTALTILDGSNIYQGGNTFDANYIGIFSPQTGFIKTHYGSPVRNSTFTVKTIAQYYHTDKDYKEAFMPTASELILIESLNENIEDILDQVEVIYESIYSDDDYTQYETTLIDLQSQLYQSSDQLATINSIISDRGNGIIQDLKSNLSNLPSDFYFLDQLKYVWNIKMQIALNGISSVSTSQWSEVRIIANSCILEYGNAVFEARVLMNEIGETEFVKDDECTMSFPRSGNDEVHEIMVYPNPSNGYYHLDVEGYKNMALLIEVYDVYGMHVYTQYKEAHNASHDIDLSNNTNGIYYLKISTDTSILFAKKLILIK